MGLRKFNSFSNCFKTQIKKNFAGEEYNQLENRLGLDLKSEVFKNNHNLNIRQIHVDHAAQFVKTLEKIRELEIPKFTNQERKTLDQFRNIEKAWSICFEKKEKTTIDKENPVPVFHLHK